MKIIVTGNMGSGKTSIAKSLSKKMKAELVELDEFRRKYNKNKNDAGEAKAKLYFLNKISKSKKKQVIELTGSGRTYETLLSNIKGTPHKIILVECGKIQLLKRMKERLEGKYKFPPFPKSWKGFSSSREDLENALIWFEDNIKVKSDIKVNSERDTLQECVSHCLNELGRR